MWIWLALAALAALAARRFFGGYPGPGLRVLAPREAALVAAAADALFPPGGAVPPSGVDAGVPDYVDRWLAAVPARVRILLRLLFALVEHATLVFWAPPPRGWRRFSALAHEQQVAVLEGWRGSRLFPRRLVFLALRSAISMGYFADPAVLRQLDLAPRDFPTPVLEADLLYPPVGKPRSAIRWGPADLTPPSDGTPLPLDTPLHPAFRPGGRGMR
jgi:hypothetical protein